MKSVSIRKLSVLSSLFCLVALVAAGFLQLYQGLSPCPLCIVQRVTYLALGLLFLVGSCLPLMKATRRSYYAVVTLVAVFGVGVSARHVWLQQLPADQVPAGCGMDLTYMVNHLPLNETVRVLLTGAGECAKVDWSFLGLSLASWSMLGFVFLMLLALVQVIRPDFNTHVIRYISSSEENR